MFQKLLLIALMIVVVVSSAQADRRKYAFTYQTTTLAQDATEIEFYQTVTNNENQADNWEYRIEIEQGISPKFDIGIYQIFAQTTGESFKWDAFQVRGRYRFGLQGNIAFDPVLYVEYRRKVELKSGQNKLEAKLLLGKDFGKTNFSINPIYEYLWASDFDSYSEIGLDAGLSYAPTFKISFGIESTTRRYFYTEAGKENKYKTSVGPTISYAVGDNYYTVGVVFGVNDKADDTKFRFLMGVGL